MTAKTGSLVRELAGLFTKYSLADWQPLIQELSEAGPRNERLAKSIKDYIDIASERNRVLKKARSKPARKKVQRQDAAAAFGKLAPLRAALLKKEVLATPRDLRSAAASIGMKEPLPNDRRAAVQKMLDHLDRLPSESMKSAIKKIRSGNSGDPTDHGTEFERWAALILRPRDES